MATAKIIPIPTWARKEVLEPPQLPEPTKPTLHYFLKDHSRAREQVANEVFAVNGRGLGDVWGSICYFCKLGEDFNVPIKLSRYYVKRKRQRPFYPKAAEVIPLLDTKTVMNFVDGDPTVTIRHQNIGYIPYYPTRVRWFPEKKFLTRDLSLPGKPSESNSITACYQFDGKSHSGQKNMPKEHEELIFNALRERGLVPIRVGGHQSLLENVKQLAACRLFVGVDSGFAHVACSVRCPTYIIKNRRPPKDLDSIYYGKGVRFVENAFSFVENLGKEL